MADGSRVVVVRTTYPVALLCTVLLVVLKLTGNCDWSWAWVLSPLWIGAAIFVGSLLLFFLLFTLWAAFLSLLDR
jgi:uncharacterized membrane protein YgdD (TMEM256/DUF423 family)